MVASNSKLFTLHTLMALSDEPLNSLSLVRRGSTKFNDTIAAIIHVVI